MGTHAYTYTYTITQRFVVYTKDKKRFTLWHTFL